MKRLFAIIRSRGPAWQPSLPLEQQPEWAAHAQFMEDLHAEGFVLLVGPLEGTSDALLIVRAEGEHEIHQRLSADPWESSLLQTTRIAPWQLRLGEL